MGPASVSGVALLPCGSGGARIFAGTDMHCSCKKWATPASFVLRTKEVTGVAMTELAARIEALLESSAAEHGLELVAVEQAGGRKTPVIRVLLDREGGIDIEELARANQWISAVLDEAEPIHGPYTLEVSSPGIDRPLRRPEDFERFAGQTATVKTRSREGRGAWTGTIVGMEGGDIVLDVDGEEVRIAFDDMTKARLKGEVDFGS